VSQSQVEKVQRYIANQQRHHERVSFKEEFIALLDAHGVDYDEKYLWD
jgi:REP-associated tyrosine transposase